ncbi:MAG: hypothetical protein WCL07_00315 [bacterium]
MSGLPKNIARFFWGDDLGDLSWEKHENYITQTLLDRGDRSALVWLFGKTRIDSIRQRLDKFKLSKKSANFWKVYLP